MDFHYFLRYVYTELFFVIQIMQEAFLRSLISILLQILENPSFTLLNISNYYTTNSINPSFSLLIVYKYCTTSSF